MLKNLHELNLSDTNIRDISGFDVKNLRKLDLSYTHIGDILGFDVKNLRKLDLYKTNITKEMKDKLREKVERSILIKN